ncbi:MAG: hypothetical protein M0R06_04815 [Sphaerochaeta sp.]|jgi:hypothetical protein|nr:hypothetical protein [Sphaerochaeta sp.]
MNRLNRFLELVCAGMIGAIAALIFVGATAPGEGGTASDASGFYWQNFLSLGRNGMSSNSHLMASPLDLSHVDLTVNSITVSGACKAGRLQAYPQRTESQRTDIKADPANDGSFYTVSMGDGSTGLMYMENGKEYVWETDPAGLFPNGLAAVLLDATGTLEERELRRAGG